MRRSLCLTALLLLLAPWAPRVSLGAENSLSDV